MQKKTVTTKSVVHLPPLLFWMIAGLYLFYLWDKILRLLLLLLLLLLVQLYCAGPFEKTYYYSCNDEKTNYNYYCY